MEKTISKNKNTDLNEGINLNEILERESNLYLFIKRSIDIICSLAGIIVLSPIFLIVAILIKIEDPKGRIFFCQERNGQHPKTFKMYKDMSLVGPRPPIPREVEQYNSYQKQRLLVKPGLTCIWQVSGRNNIGFDEWVEMDLEYIKNRNLLLDIKLILKTVKVLFGDSNAS